MTAGRYVTTGDEGFSLRAYLQVVWRWKWLVLLVTLAVAAAGSAWVWTRPPVYEATAQLVYSKQLDIADPLGQSYIDTTARQAKIESVPTVLASREVATAARARMRPATLRAGYSVSAVLEPGLDNKYSSVVGIRGSSGDPAAAADAANAYAEAFVEWDRESALAEVRAAIAVVRERLATYTSAADRETMAYQSLRQRLQDLQLLEATARGDFTIITAASPPSAPAAPRKTRGVVLAVAAGLVLGLGAAALRDQFDTRVRDGEEVAATTGLPVLARVPPPSRKARERGVVETLSDPAGAAAEAYRVLRSNLEFAAVDAEVRTLVLSSAVQGEGKSVVAANLAVSLALAGKRVVLVDADLRVPRIHTYLGLPNARGVSTVLSRRGRLEEALVPLTLTPGQVPGGPVVVTVERGGAVRKVAAASPRQPDAGSPPVAQAAAAGWEWPDANGGGLQLRVLTSGPLPPNPGELVASRRFAALLADLADDADLVLVDAPAMLPVGDTAALAAGVDGLVFVSNPRLLQRPALRLVASQLAHLPCRLLGLVLVVPRQGQGYYGYAGTESVLGGSRA